MCKSHAWRLLVPCWDRLGTTLASVAKSVMPVLLPGKFVRTPSLWPFYALVLVPQREDS
jgi:hypothetical protein